MYFATNTKLSTNISAACGRRVGVAAAAGCHIFSVFSCSSYLINTKFKFIKFEASSGLLLRLQARNVKFRLASQDCTTTTPHRTNHSYPVHIK